MKPKLGISDRNREGVVKILNPLLSDEFLLYTKTRKHHWNVTGPHFHDLHKLFESQYEELDEIVDEVAERARSLGGIAFGTLSEFLQHARLKEKAGLPAGQAGKNPPASGMIADLLSDHEALVQILRTDLEACADLGDAGTSDFLTGLMERHEKMAWMLRALLEGKR